MSEPDLRLTEIFYSLQGETTTAGLPTVFIRLTGCPLRCGYCDTEYAFYGGKKHSLGAILTEVEGYSARHVTVTGGEPLAQPNCLALLTALCDQGYRVSLETSGALPITGVDKRVHIILDIKTPGSGEVSKNHWENIPVLSDKDEIKFVICDRADYEWVRMTLDRYQLASTGAELLLSPSQSQLEARQLADWMLEDKLQARIQLQLHKYLWGDEQGR